MYIVTVHFEIHDEHMAEFMDKMKAQANNSLQLEDECFLFDVCTDSARPGEVYLYEVYASRAAFDLHLASGHFKEFDAAVQPMLKSKSVQTWDRHYRGT